MGLDMYAHTADRQDLPQVDADLADPAELAYWRKFNHLHGWMERLYQQKGGTQEFNCTNVRLEVADLDRLLADAPTLEPTKGFFFGSYDPITSDGVQEIADFVEKAKAAIEEGKAVYYSSWW